MANNEGVILKHQILLRKKNLLIFQQVSVILFLDIIKKGEYSAGKI